MLRARLRRSFTMFMRSQSSRSCGLNPRPLPRQSKKSPITMAVTAPNAPSGRPSAVSGRGCSMNGPPGYARRVRLGLPKRAKPVDDPSQPVTPPRDILKRTLSAALLEHDAQRSGGRLPLQASRQRVRRTRLPTESPAGRLFQRRPKQEPKFDGISFSTNVHLPGKNQSWYERRGG